MKLWQKLIAVAYFALQVALITAKLVGAVAWPWAGVLAPLWVPVVLAIVAAIVLIALFANASANGGNPFQ